MKQVYAEYFQKSKVFLYPLLEIRKGVRYVPVETYTSWKDVYDIENSKFLCLYSAEYNDKYKRFEQVYLKSHKLFEKYHELDDDVHLYVYDFSKFKHDLDMFKVGKYSKFTLKTKEKISNFFGDVGTIADYIQSYIHPEDFHEHYAEHLAVPLNTIEEVYELCSKPDLEKEELNHIKPTELDSSEDNSLSLSTDKSKEL
tara:strand:+ start:27565 stop:28161 length:597 start_codon:yes stop_codon:yes gene_type:complete